MADGLKKKARPWVDLLVTYGWEAIRIRGGPRIDYQFLVGLFFLLPRAESRLASRVYRGIGESFLRSPSYELFASLYDNDDFARAEHERTTADAALREQRAMSELSEKVRTTMETM